MPNENETSRPNETSTPEPTTQPGPSLLTERSFVGIFVHLLGLGTGFVGTSFVYFLSQNEFTRSNARHATNWQLLFWGVHFIWFGAIGALFLFDFVFPDTALFNAILMGLFVVVGGAFFVTGILLIVSLAFVFVAFGKAIFGTAWEYPLAPDFVGWIGARTPDQPRWWLIIAAYALVATVLFGYLAWLVIVGGPEPDALFFAFFFLLLGSMVASLFTLVALYRDASVLADRQAEWQPNWVAYTAGPLVVGMGGYFVAATFFQSQNPSGDAVYAFMFALWGGAVVYLSRRYKYATGP